MAPDPLNRKELQDTAQQLGIPPTGTNQQIRTKIKKTRKFQREVRNMYGSKSRFSTTRILGCLLLFIIVAMILAQIYFNHLYGFFANMGFVVPDALHELWYDNMPVFNATTTLVLAILASGLVWLQIW